MISSISFIVIIVQSPEIYLKLEPMQVIQELKPEELEASKRYLEQCDLSKEEYQRINEIIFAADKTLFLEKDPIKAESIFKAV